MNANRNYATDYVVHAIDQGADCGRKRARDAISSTNRADVTCKRCLAALAKAGK